MKKPNKIIIFGKTYNITYCDKPSEVDIYHRESLWGQIDYWTRTIRIYNNFRNEKDIWHNLIHEIIHGILSELHFDEENKNHTFIDKLALGLMNVLYDNGLFKEDKK